MALSGVRTLALSGMYVPLPCQGCPYPGVVRDVYTLVCQGCPYPGIVRDVRTLVLSGMSVPWYCQGCLYIDIVWHCWGIRTLVSGRSVPWCSVVMIKIHRN